MRLIMTLAMSALLLASVAPLSASAQRGTETVRPLRVVTAPAQRFRARSASERLAVARELTQGLRITINEAYFNTPFSLTPRTPEVVGRGWLDARDVGAWYAHIPANDASQPWAGPDGAILIHPVLGEADVHLANAQGHRFLVDCAVHGVYQVRARTQSGATASINAQNGAIISIVTAPGEDMVTITGSGGNWRLLGCEITRLQ